MADVDRRPGPSISDSRARYAQNPTPELPVSNFRALGGLTWVNQNGVGRSLWEGERNNFQPRIGFSWQFAKDTVPRGGVKHNRACADRLQSADADSVVP